MKRIGLLSDTHGTWDHKLEEFFSDCTEIWHAGDIGNLETAQTIERFKPLVAVHGNIDDYKTRMAFPKIQQFICENTLVLITHIGGYPNRYEPEVKQLIENLRPNLFICGHSHILKVIYDKKYELLHINPGAAGTHGLHRIRTAVRFSIEGSNIKDLEILEIPRKTIIGND